MSEVKKKKIQTINVNNPPILHWIEKLSPDPLKIPTKISATGSRGEIAVGLTGTPAHQFLK